MLNSLEIKNFRLLEDFKVAKLGRVNLIVGKNNSGKSTVLEALRIYAGNANRGLLESIAKAHDEPYALQEAEQNTPDTSLPFESFFSGRQFNKDYKTIVMGELAEDEQALHIQHVLLGDKEMRFDGMGNSQRIRERRVIEPSNTILDDIPIQMNGVPRSAILSTDDSTINALLIKKATFRYILPFDSSGFAGVFTQTTPCSFIPTQFVPVDELAKEWDKIVFTEHGEIVRKALKIIAPTFEDLVFVQGNEKRFALVKVADATRPVPLKSLGDGMVRVLQLALKLVSAKGGFLLIDEFENGLHYSIQEKIWVLLFEMAENIDIQIFATTHSWDCIESFTKVAISNEKTQGIVFRMGKSALKSNKGQTIATVYDKAALYDLTQINIEIR